jgi:hypothetical protein
MESQFALQTFGVNPAILNLSTSLVLISGADHWCEHFDVKCAAWLPAFQSYGELGYTVGGFCLILYIVPMRLLPNERNLRLLAMRTCKRYLAAILG